MSETCPTCGSALTYIGFGAYRCTAGHVFDQDDPKLSDEVQE